MTLSQAAVLTKQIITITVAALVLGTISFIGYKIWYAYYIASLPPVEEKPDTKFGVLPSPDFPKSLVSSSNFSYSVDTTTGNLPIVGKDPGFEKIAKVYFVTKTFATLLSAEKSKTLAAKFGITNPPQVLSETIYQFKEDDKTLNLDLDSGNFTFENSSSVLSTEGLDDDNKLIADFERILNDLGILKPDIKGRNKVIRAEDIALISLWPSNIDNKSIMTSQFDTSEIYARVVKSADNLENYKSLNFFYYPIEISTFATYPIKTTEQAFEDLKSGKGVIIIEPNSPKISMTSVYLGYFLGENYSPYLQPIFIFEGSSFVAYVTAISPEFIGSQ